MSEGTAAIIGVTGLIGSRLYEVLKQSRSFDTIRLIVRRPIATKDPKTEIKLVDFNDPESLMLAIDGSHVVFCAVGTTMKKVAGDKEAYRRIDFDIPIKAANACKMVGCETFVVVSSIGADTGSRNFYLRLKGEMEKGLKSSGVTSVHVMQPSMLLGERSEKRPGEGMGKNIFRFISPLLLGSLRKYRPIDAADVAQAMVKAAESNRQGFFIYQYDDMNALSQENK